MSPELETLDQLLAGDLPLSTIRKLYASDERFIAALSGLLLEGDVELADGTGNIVPQWRWQVLLRGSGGSLPLTARITDQGARKIG